MFAQFFNRNKTFKPLKGHKAGSKAEALHDFARATLGTGDVMSAVTLPEGEDVNEWLATNTVDFFNSTALIYGAIADSCTAETCPTMSAGPRYEYLWMDGVTVVKPLRCSAPEYLDRMLTWVEEQLNNEALFPTRPGTPFPPNWRLGVCAPILKRLARVFGHVYHHHFDAITQLGAEKHLNTAFKHFVAFALTFKLVDPKELAPLQELVDTLLPDMAAQGATGSGGAAPSATAAVREGGGAARGPPPTSSHAAPK